MKNTERHAFTLAEVLIALGIIGVLAEMTIPTLMNNVQDAELKTAWKKSFAEMSAAIMQLTMENGGGLDGLYKNSDEFLLGYSTVAKLIKTCDLNVSGFWHQENSFKFLNTINCPYGYNIGTSAISANGSLIFFYLNDSNCMEDWGATGYKRCAEIWIDVNGFKKPNIVGKDIFATGVTRDSVYPRGISGDIDKAVMCENNNTDANNLGWGCSAKLLLE